MESKYVKATVQYAREHSGLQYTYRPDEKSLDEALEKIVAAARDGDWRIVSVVKLDSIKSVDAGPPIEAVLCAFLQRP